MLTEFITIKIGYIFKCLDTFAHGMTEFINH